MNRSRLNGNKTHNKLYLKKVAKKKNVVYPVNYTVIHKYLSYGG